MVGWASADERAGGVESIQVDMVRHLGARLVDVREAAHQLGVDLGPYQRHSNIDRACLLAEYVALVEQHQDFDAVISAADCGAFLRTRAPLILYWHNPYRDIAELLHREGAYDRLRLYEYGQQYPALQEHGAKRAIANVAVSPWMGGYLGRCRTRCDRVIPLGVDADQFAPASSAERERMRKSLGLPADRPLVLFTGAFHPVSGYAVVDALRARVPEWSWLMVFKELKPRKTTLLGRESVVYPEPDGRTCVLECLRRGDMADVYRAADVMVSASPIESFNLKAVEALTCGTPVVTTRAGIFADWPSEGPFGAVVDSRDPAAFEAAIGRVLSGEIGRDPRSASVPYLTLDRFERDWRALLTHVVDHHQRRVSARRLPALASAGNALRRAGTESATPLASL